MFTLPQDEIMNQTRHTFPFSIGCASNKYSAKVHVSSYTDSNTAFLFTLPLSFPLDIFAHCHLWNTVKPKGMSAEPASQCKLLAVSLRTVNSVEATAVFRPMLLAGSVQASSMHNASSFLQTFPCLDFIVSVSTRTLMSLLKAPVVAASIYGEIT